MSSSNHQHIPMTKALKEKESVEVSLVPKPKQFEDVIDALGPPGRYQFLQIFCMSVCVMPTIFISINYVFIGYEPQFECSEINGTKHFQDKFYVTNGTSSHYQITHEACQIQIDSNSSDKWENVDTLGCLKGYTYNGGKGVSIITEWDLVCDERGTAELSQTAVAVGWLFGVLFASSLADKYGRKSTIAVAVALSGLFELCVAFAPSIYVLIGLRFFSGVFGSCMDVTIYVLGAEILVSKYRGTYGMFVGGLWSFYVMLLSGIAYMFSNDGWRDLQLCTSIMCLSPLLLVYFIDESPSWLYSIGNFQRASQIIRKTCEWNGSDFERVGSILDDVFSHAKKSDGIEKSAKGVKSSNLFDMFRNGKIRTYMFIAWVSHFTTELTYFGLYFNSSTVGNLYFNMFVMALLEFPSCLLTVVLLRYKGRCFIIMSFMTIAALCVLSSACLMATGSDAEFVSNLSTTFFFLGKFSISSSYNTLAMYVPEIFPTTHRSLGLGVCVTGSCFGGMLAPYLLPLFNIAHWAPGTLLCGLCLLTVLLMFKLPETKDEQLSATITQFSKRIELEFDVPV